MSADTAVLDVGWSAVEETDEVTATSVSSDDVASREKPSCDIDRESRPAHPSVSVIVPTLNEARNLPYAMWRLPECVTEVVVVDGRSNDDTVEAARRMRPDVRIVLETTKGKGAALQSGFAAATGDIIVMLDADGSADGAEIQRFVDVLLAGADFAKGSRFLAGGGSVDLTMIRSLGNKALTALVNGLCQTRFTDLCYGYNAFWRDCVDVIDVDVDGFEVETRMMIKAAVSGLAVVEVPSWEHDRVHGSSNLHAVSDGIRVLRAIMSSAAELRHGRRAARAIPALAASARA